MVLHTLINNNYHHPALVIVSYRDSVNMYATSDLTDQLHIVWAFSQPCEFITLCDKGKL